jgi:hypothetical protein
LNSRGWDGKFDGCWDVIGGWIGSANRSIPQTRIGDTIPAQIANLAIFDYHGL